MTQVRSSAPIPSTTIPPTIHYTVAMPRPETHFFEVSLTLLHWTTSHLDLKFPVWTPGSYLVREYARHLQDFSAKDFDGNPLIWQKISKNHWQVDTPDPKKLIIHYRIFANELTVRTNHLDATHGYFNPAALFFRILGWEQQAIAITIVPPQPNWHVTTPLCTDPSQPQTFIAQTFDELVDSPFEIGTHAIYPFDVLGKPHQFAIWGQGYLPIDRILADTQKIIEKEAELFGGLPYDRYLFLFHLATNSYGGLEHRTACSLIYSQFGLGSEDGYSKFMSLVAHEFFHLWNVKRIRPQGLEIFDYDQENYTDSLWFSEGTTSFYDLVIPFRAGIYDAKTYLKKVSDAISQLLTTPGRHHQALSESSFDAWIKLYRPDANSRNTQVSYYLKGELVSFLLDLLIRSRSQNRKSLDDVMRLMWQQFGQPEIGFSCTQLKAVIESIADMDLTPFWIDYIDGTTELPFDDYLAPFGLTLQGEPTHSAPYLGLTVKAEQGITVIKGVEALSPAEQAGLDPGDELLALNGFRVTAEQLHERLHLHQAGDTIEVAVFHQDRLRHCRVTLGDPVITRFTVQSVAQPTPDQTTLCQGWLGCDIVCPH